MTGHQGFIAFAAAALTLGAHAADLHVPADFGTIQAAIDAAKGGDTVLVADGLYTGAGNRDLTFAGKAITVRSVDGPDGCVIDCEGTPDVPFRGFAFRNGEGRDSVVQGFTIRNGATLQGAIDDRFNGAGILVTQESSPTIRDMVITGSWAGCWGGAICCSFESHPLIERCRLIGNHSDDDGGGVFAWAGSSPTIVNSVIANNTSRVTGGGVTMFGGAVDVVNTTIVGNTAPFGAGVWANSLATFSNSIIWGNLGDVEEVQGTPTVTYSLVAGGHVGTGNVDTVPNFVDAEKGNLRLAANSPLVQAGDPAYEPGVDETDADGNPRVAGGRVDMGAFEYQDTPCRADIDGDASIGFADLLSLLATWGTCSGCGEDLDQDGSVDFGDLLSMLAAWGPCPE